MGFISDNYGVEQTSPLMTDKYHFTTAYGYWLEGRADNPSVFYMFGRKEALGGGYTVAGGLEGVIDIVRRWQEHGLTHEDIAFLRAQKTPMGQPQFPEEFLKYLKNMKFRLKIDAVPEGTVFFPQEPVLRVEGPLAQVKMLESVALCLINGHSGYVTQAARQCDAVGKTLDNGSPVGQVSVQGLRRGPSLGAALEASRSLGLGGYASSSTGTAAREFGQPFAGTMDHAWVMTHRRELGDITLAQMHALQKAGKTDALREALAGDAFRSFAFAFPDSGILLVDTYDPVKGLENAITVIKELRELGRGVHYGVRFDSGDIVKYSKLALRRFAEEGFVTGINRVTAFNMPDAELLKQSRHCTVFCAAADGIDEFAAQKMRADGGFFRSWGVGTAGSHVAPLGLVYKASAVYMGILDGREKPEEMAMTPVMKVASNAPVKSSNPGRINSRRYYDASGKIAYAVIFDEDLELSENGEMVNLRNFSERKNADDDLASSDLLVPVFDDKGKYVYEGPERSESWSGSGHKVTDLAALARRVMQQLATLPDDVRAIVRPKDDILKKKLLELYKEAKGAGNALMQVDIARLDAALPPEVGHVPVYLDMNLFSQRMQCEQKHMGQANAEGVASYQERFESAADEAVRKRTK